MLPFESPQTADLATEAMSALVDSAWVLAAVVNVLGRRLEPSYAADDAAAGVLAAAGLFEPTETGFAPAAGVVELMQRSGDARVEAARSVLGQAAAATRGGRIQEGWAQQDDETLLAQGAASGRLLPVMMAVVSKQCRQLEDSLRAPGARFLDVGVGVAGMACAFAEAIPSLSVVGIDPFERALRLGREQVAARALQDRVSLRLGSVEDVDDEGLFDVAWLPAPFIPPVAFRTGVTRLYQALRPGGWILVGMGRLERHGVSSAVTRWQTELLGGTPLTPQEAESVLAEAGFTAFRALDTPPGAPVVVCAQRPSRPSRFP